ncbi:MAG: aminotransferase class IV [Flavobacteriales bacterium]|nr:aminotransferase class IV [Flavobacteriales bacterium]
MTYIIFNNKILRKDDFHISISNRSFLYGDGLFESIKIINGKPFNIDSHLDRLFLGASFLNLEITASKNDFQHDIANLLTQVKIKKAGYVKIVLFRNQGGKYLPKTQNASYLITAEKSENNLFDLNNNGLELGFFTKLLKPKTKLSNYKTTSALQSVMCLIDAKQKGKDDCLMFNTDNRIIESANSNVFYVKNDTIYTPKLTEGCVGGTMRNYILNLKNMGFLIEESLVEKNDILQADEVFLSNAISGIRWVSKIENTEFTKKKVAQMLIEKINQLV